MANLLLKDLYNIQYIDNLSNNLSKIYTDFKKENFIKDIFNNDWKNKELKQRMRHISIALGLHLPKDYNRSIDILKEVFILMPTNLALENMIFQNFVEVYGLDKFQTSMDALECFTQYSSSEFAIRQFILNYEDKTIQVMKEWAISKSEHTRRLASEGGRSRLPWAMALPKFKKDPSKILEILELLKDDESKYVQKSVANNLNDISKDNPQIVKQIASKWIGKSKNLDWIVKHGCRTLLKEGDSEVLDLFGFGSSNNIFIEDIKVSQEVYMGENLDFSFKLGSCKDLGRLRVEYAINFVRLKGKSGRKVFKICEGDYSDVCLMINKKYSFKKITTRKYYVGKHSIEFIVNGVSLSEHKFELVDIRNI